MLDKIDMSSNFKIDKYSTATNIFTLLPYLILKFMVRFVEKNTKQNALMTRHI